MTNIKGQLMLKVLVFLLGLGNAIYFHIIKEMSKSSTTIVIATLSFTAAVFITAIIAIVFEAKKSRKEDRDMRIVWTALACCALTIVFVVLMIVTNWISA